MEPTNKAKQIFDEWFGLDGTEVRFKRGQFLVNKADGELRWHSTFHYRELYDMFDSVGMLITVGWADDEGQIIWWYHIQIKDTFITDDGFKSREAAEIAVFTKCLELLNDENR